MDKPLTRKERKRVAKGKPCVKKVKIVKVREIKASSIERLTPFDMNNYHNDLDFIAATRRDQYTKGYMKGIRDIENGTYKKIEETENKTDQEMFKTINTICGEEKLIIINGIMSWFRENCYSQGYNSAMINTKIVLPKNFKIL